MEEEKARVWRLENKLRPHELRAKEVSIEELYLELRTEHSYLLAVIKPIKGPVSWHKIGHPRWF